jgi:CspA family cold shock protein
LGRTGSLNGPALNGKREVRRHAAKVEHGGSALAKGKVKWFSDQKGYGFIVPDDGSSDLFVHYSNIVGDGFRTLQEDQEVEYEKSEGKKGPEATDVRPL